MDSSSEKSKSEGNKHCCYGTCNNDSRYRHRENMEGVFFILFPKPLSRRQTCEKWIKACGRPDDDFNCSKIKRSTYICSKHFVGGKGPTEKNPDPIPVLLHTDEQMRRFERKRKPPTPRRKVVKISRRDVQSAAECLLDLGKEMSGSHTPSSCEEQDVETMDNDKCTQTDVASKVDKEIQTVYEKEILNAKIENMLLKNQIKTKGEQENLMNLEAQVDTSLSLKAVKNDSAKMKLFTGLTYEQFLILFKFLGDSVYNLTYWDGKGVAKESSRTGIRKLQPEDEFFLTLVRLRRGYTLDTLAHFFGIAASTVSTIFSTWIQLLYCHFNDLREDMFPERQHLKHNLPRIFRTFKNIRCTIDCTEFFVQMPRDFKRQGNLYSSNKNHHTYKFLVAIAPNGSIVYIYQICMKDLLATGK